MKWCGIVLVAFVPIWISITIMARWRERIHLMETLVKLSRRMQALLTYQALPVSELLEQATAGEGYESVAFLTAYMPGAKTTDPSRCSLPYAVPRDVALIKEFLSGLGTTDLSGQLAHCGLYEALFEEQRKAAISVMNQRGRLCYSLGGLGAALCVILLL